MLNDLDTRPIVLDNGSYTVKAGYAGESAPRVLVPTLITQSFTAWGSTDWYVGEHAKALRRQLPVSRPVSHGTVTNMEEMSMIWHYLYSRELRVHSADHPLLIIEYPQLPHNHREKIAEMMFEKFNIPGLYTSDQSVLSLYASGLTTGLTVDIGNDTTSIVPVQETFTMKDAIRQRHLGGLDVTNYLQRLLVSSNPTAAQFITAEVTQYFKEKFCHVVPSITKELMSEADSKPVKFKAPDGQIVSIGKERFCAPELLFRPSQGGLEGSGLSQYIISAIQNCPSNIQPYLLSNIVLSGGCTLFSGLPQRVEQEVNHEAPSGSFVKVYALEQRKYSAWIGGSILASLSTFNKVCVTKQEYQEHGNVILKQKCP
ncbi:Fast-type skeletal muscle actin 12 [Paragonimus heterotremus]|uniref:Fast-type skeletal muscle actin 12 n=1 Tax=Paragonimus heterotremus TaxID=100268 RepID=A0A8J4TJ57_9TREM|nr:Fast-type skeletal muscle actin 12 [Paragonimus heterotremus]